MNLAVQKLLAWYKPEGYWEGQLSPSALSTATALTALALAKQPGDAQRIQHGIAWLARTQLSDGGWGDTPDSPSNLSTTLLALSALTLAGANGEPIDRADAYVTARAGATTDERVAAIRRIYGQDRTFAVPILMNCALASLAPWSAVPGLQFELSVVPHSWYHALRLNVVSYALPALIAVGLVIDGNNPTRNPVLRWIRRLATPPALAKLRAIQPEHGGFLDATPLTSFVAMSLLNRFGADQPVASKCLQFLRASQRDDGSWPIDTCLSVWVTTSAVTALARVGALDKIDANATAQWLAQHQYRTVHPFTNAAPGGWGWIHLPGGVPDADDTSGAIIALNALGVTEGIAEGIRWLRDLQNADGGWPTFCKGWGQLPFDQSSPDITAHALRAMHAAGVPEGDTAVQRGLKYLSASQRPNGAWFPLWFGNQAAPDHQNPVLGTARALRALAVFLPKAELTERAVAYLIREQNNDGGWGGAYGVRSSVEETSLAICGLTPWRDEAPVASALGRAARWLDNAIADGALDCPAPIGLYFSSLWYSERLYPLIWATEALGALDGRK